jgi:hypothetical protein
LLSVYCLFDQTLKLISSFHVCLAHFAPNMSFSYLRRFIYTVNGHLHGFLGDYSYHFKDLRLIHKSGHILLIFFTIFGFQPISGTRGWIRLGHEATRSNSRLILLELHRNNGAWRNGRGKIRRKTGLWRRKFGVGSHVNGHTLCGKNTRFGPNFRQTRARTRGGEFSLHFAIFSKLSI